MFVKLIVGIISQCMHASNHHVYTLRILQFLSCIKLKKIMEKMGNGAIICFRSILGYSLSVNGCLLGLKLLKVTKN